MLLLHRVSSYTGEFTRSLVWPPQHPDEVVFMAASAVVGMRVDGSSGQRFFLGHTAHVCSLAFDAQGDLMASGQEGKQAIIRLWDFRTGLCLSILNGRWGVEGWGEGMGGRRQS